MTIPVTFTFDGDKYRHYMDGHLLVLRGHNYLPLMAKEAIEFDYLGGIKIHVEEAEDAIRHILDDAIAKHGLTDPAERLAAGVTYYEQMWLGLMTVVKADAAGGEVTLKSSHVDEGWQRKFGKSVRPINFFTMGFVAAMFAAAFGKAPHSYDVVESESMAMGAPAGRFIVTAK